LLVRLRQLRELVWHEPAIASHPDLLHTLDSLAELTQLKQLSLGCNSVSVNVRVAAGRKMPMLEYLRVGLFFSDGLELDLPSIEWDMLNILAAAQHLFPADQHTHARGSD
jgi:hypothetical protein